MQVQYKSETGEVKKLFYQSRGPFQIKSVLVNNSYKVQRYNEPESATRNYKDTDLYLLPPAIFLQEPLDTMDVHFLKYSQAPIISPLHKPLRIEMYNDKYFNPNHLKKKVKQPSKYQASNQVDLQSFKTHSKPKIPPTK